MDHGITEPLAHRSGPGEENLGSEKTKAAAMNPVIKRVLEKTTHPQRSLVGPFPYNSEKLGDSMIDRP